MRLLQMKIYSRIAENESFSYVIRLVPIAPTDRSIQADPLTDVDHEYMHPIMKECEVVPLWRTE